MRKTNLLRLSPNSGQVVTPNLTTGGVRSYLLTLSTRKISLICLFIAAAALSCAVHPPIVLDDIEYVRQARDYQQQEKYKDAREEYLKVLENHPESKYMAEARLGIADSYFHNKEYIEAAAKYEEFLKYYPRNPLAEQAEFRLAMSHYNQRLEVDRDQSETRKTMDAFEKLIKDFPQSPLNDDARKYLMECYTLLAEHEIYIGQFYLRREDYYSAIGRFKYVLTNYQQIPIMDKAMFGLAESYQGLGKYRESYILYEQLVSAYPQSQYISEAKERMLKRH